MDTAIKNLFHGFLRVTLATVLSVFIWKKGSLFVGEYTSINLINTFLISIVWAISIGRPIATWIGGAITKGILTPSDDSFDLKPEYSIPETHARQGRYEEAIEGFREYIYKYPHEVTPHLRIVDLQLEKFHDPKAAIAELKIAISKSRRVESFSLLNFRLSELYITYQENFRAALRCLRKVQSRYPRTRQAEAASEREERVLQIISDKKTH